MTHHRHIVLLKWKPDASIDQINHVKKSVLDLPHQIPNILSYRWHQLRQSSHSNAQGYHALIDSIFTSTDSMLHYEAHPVHANLVVQHLLPIIDQILVVDHVLPESFEIDEYFKQETQPHIHMMSFITPKPALELTPLITKYQK